MLIEPPVSSVSAQSHKFGQRISGNLGAHSFNVKGVFGVVTWLALFGTVVAGALVIMLLEISDGIWLFNQAP